MKLKKFGLQAGIFSMALLGQEVMAADRELLDILLANGSITRAQYDQLLKKKEPLTKNDVEVSLGAKGLRFKTANGNFKMKIGGRLHADGSIHSEDNIGNEDISDGTDIRRARLHVKGVIFQDWHYKAQYDFAGNKTRIKDLYLKYTGFDWFSIAVGHQKQPFSLQLQMSSNDIPFIERSLDNGLVEPLVDRAIGVRLDSHGKHWFAAGGLYGDSAGGKNKSDEGWGVTGRFALAPIRSKEQVVHFAVNGAYRVPQNGKSVRFRDKTTHKSNVALIDTGSLITGLDNTILAGAEAATAIGPFSLEGEYTHAFVNRRGNHVPTRHNLGFDGFHIQAAWSLTGESRAASYKMSGGKFKRLKPAHYFSLSQGGWGAWEVAARYAWIDLNDQDIKGGKEQAFTVGLNWYLNPNIRLMADWTRVLDTSHALGANFTSNADAAASGLDIIQLRTQLTF